MQHHMFLWPKTPLRGMFLGPIWERSGTDLGPIWDRSGTDLGSIWDRFRIDLGSIWDRFGIDLGSIWDRFRDYQGPSGTLPAASETPKNIKKPKNRKFQFLQVGFEALDERNRLVIFPKVENMGF